MENLCILKLAIQFLTTKNITHQGYLAFLCKSAYFFTPANTGTSWFFDFRTFGCNRSFQICCPALLWIFAMNLYTDISNKLFLVTVLSQYFHLLWEWAQGNQISIYICEISISLDFYRRLIEFEPKAILSVRICVSLTMSCFRNGVDIEILLN